MRVALSVALTLSFSTSATALAYGEADAEGRPNASERRLHLLTNQVRAEPHAFAGWDTQLASDDPRPPLVLDAGLLAAARFHAEDMASSGLFQHESSDGTPAGARIARFFSGGGSGENIAKGQTDELAAMVAWMNSTTGHRENILREGWNALGTGTAAGRHWVQNFGAARSGSTPAIVAAASFDEGSSLRLSAHAFDASGRAPTRFEARLDGDAVALAPVAGRPGHRTWSAQVARPTGCADLVFFLEDAAGITHRHPTTGVLLAGTGCPASFRMGAATDDPRRPVIDADIPDAGGCRCAGPKGPAIFGGWLVGLGLAVVGISRRRIRTAA